MNNPPDISQDSKEYEEYAHGIRKHVRGYLMVGATLLVWNATGAIASDIVVVGTGDGMEVLRAVGAAYTADHPQNGVLVPPSVHSSGGIAARCCASSDCCWAISRPVAVPTATRS